MQQKLTDQEIIQYLLGVVEYEREAIYQLITAISKVSEGAVTYSESDTQLEINKEAEKWLKKMQRTQ